MAGDSEEGVPIPSGHEHVLQTHRSERDSVPDTRTDAEREKDRRDAIADDECETATHENITDPPPLGVSVGESLGTKETLG